MFLSLFKLLVPKIFPYFFSIREGYRAFKSKSPSALDLIRLLKIPKVSDETIKHTILEYGQDKEDIFFIQIGSNDGKKGDPIYDIVSASKKWKGILVEPIPFIYKKLVDNYAMRSDLLFEQSIISDRTGEKKLYFIDPIAQSALNLPWYWEQISSLSKEHIIKHFGEGIIPYIKVEEIKSLSFNKLLEKHNCNCRKIDLLHIDVEGHDYEIARQINLAQCPPQMILIEFRHLSYEDCLKLINRFRKKYEIYQNELDLFLLLK